MSAKRANRKRQIANTSLAFALFGTSIGHVRAEDVRASGDLAAKWTVDDADPEASVPSREEAMKNPLEMGYLLMDIVARAEAASARGDHISAIRYYRAMAKSVPEQAIPLRRLCIAYEATGQEANAVAACRAVLGREGVLVDDHEHFVRVLLRKRGVISEPEQKDLDSVIAHLDATLLDASGKLRVARLRADVATRLDDIEGLQRAVRELTAASADERTMLSYRFALGVAERDVEAAREVLRRARAMNLPSGAVAVMEHRISVLESEQATKLRSTFVNAAWIGAVLSVAGLALLARRKRPQLVQA